MFHGYVAEWKSTVVREKMVIELRYQYWHEV